MNFIAFRVLFKRIKAIRFMMVDKSVAKWKKLLIILGLLYIIWPYDLIPIVLFPIAWMDDLLLWIWILWTFRDTLDSYWIGEKNIDIKKDFRDKNIVDDVDFTVEDDKDE